MVRTFTAISLLLGYAWGKSPLTWCGKIYNGAQMISLPAGIMKQPQDSPNQLLDVQIIPRHSIYVGNETTAHFIVDALLSSWHGSPYDGPATTSSRANVPDSLKFTVNIQHGTVVFSKSIDVNTKDNLFSFDIQKLTPRTEAYPVTLTGTTSSGKKYEASTHIFFLPNKHTGSVVKVDRLHGSLLHRSNNTAGHFRPYFPYGYYGTYSEYFNRVHSPTTFGQHGFNALNIVADFRDGDLTYTLDEMDGTSVMLQYDMRNSYRELNSVREQIPLVKDHPSLLTYYTADEPDGWEHPFEDPIKAYHLLAELDPYHPTALVLNCQNYFFEEYSTGADIIMEDAYPIGINPTWSTKWDTEVNATYGNCGCDNCWGDSANVLNVATRINDLHKYGRWIGGAARTRKPVWAVPQAFSGEGYWARDPTARETWAMDLLAFNHGAKGRLAWLYPPSALLELATSDLARVVTSAPVVHYLTGANPVLIHDATAEHGGLDVAYWSRPGEGIMVGIVNPVDLIIVEPVEIELPAGLLAQLSQPTVSIVWGEVQWTLVGTKLVSNSMEPMEGLATSYVVIERKHEH